MGDSRDVGETRPAGEEISDDEMIREVADQTSSDLMAEEVFKRESAGATSDAEAAKTEPDRGPD